MQKDAVPAHLTALAFDFFYWFSRFEFALKENNYLKRRQANSPALPGWSEFVARWDATYQASDEAQAILKAKPEQQVVEASGELKWQATDLTDYKSDLARVVRLLQTVRNNLFHGGKHGGAGWDDPARTGLLLQSGIQVLGQFACLAGIEADYVQIY